MNEATTKLISDLAAKLGTTAEHLWGVLIRQAPISALCDILLFATFCFALYCSTTFMAKSFQKFDKTDSERWMVAIISMCIIALVCGIGIIATLTNFDQTVAGFINPEYWALKQLIK